MNLFLTCYTAWNRPVEHVLDVISPEPVAAASLGQVYRGRLLATGEQVAVKVQRPNVLASVGLDLYVMRQLAAAIQRLPSVSLLAHQKCPLSENVGWKPL